MTPVLLQVTDVLTPVAAITLTVTKVLPQITLVLAAVADILATLLARVIVPDLACVLPQLTTTLPDVMVVAAKLARVAMDLTPVRAELVRFARCHSRVTGNVWMFDSLRAHEGRTSNEQGRNSGSHSEFAHRYPPETVSRARRRGVRCSYDGCTPSCLATSLRVRPSRSPP